MNIKIIVNPAAANGRTGRQWQRTHKILQDIIARPLTVSFTERPGHATEMAGAGLREGFDTIVAVGGDGTVNEVVNGFFEDGRAISPDALLGVISQGTGKDLIKSLEIPESTEEAARVIAAGKTRRCDAGKASFIDHEGMRRERLFLNVGDLGFSGAVVERVNRSSKALGGFVSYLGGLLGTLVTYRNKTVRLRLDERMDETVVVNSVTVANGQYFGGGMWIAPEARIDDGLFEVVVVGDVSRLGVLGNVSKLYRGTLAAHPKVQYFRARKVVVESTERVLIDLDGEQPGLLPVVFEVLPRAVNCIVL